MRAALLTAALVVVFGGCRPGGAGRMDSAHGGGGRLVVALQSEGKTLDPHLANDAPSMRLIENLYATLLRYGGEPGTLEGDLAETWARSEDGRTWTFRLHPDARFHGGRPVTARDVVWSVERIRRLGVRAQHFELVERMETPDARTVVFHLRAPSAPFPWYLAHPMNAVVDRDVAERHGDRLDAAEAGAGPYTLVDWRRNDALVARAFDGYHRGRPAIDTLEFRPLPDETARVTALRTGEVDLVLEVPVREVRRLRADPSIEVGSVPGTFWEYVGVNTRRPPLDDPRVRRALALAIDRRAVNALVKRGGATVLEGGHIPPNHWAHADLTLYEGRDLARARVLLTEAGVTDGLALTLRVGSAFRPQVRAAQVVKQQLRELGVDVRLQAMESGLFFDALGRGDFDLTLVGWVGFVDPDEWTFNLFHSDGKWNQQGYADPEVDRLLERGRALLSCEERRTVYAQVQRKVALDAPMIFLYANAQVSAWRRGLDGFVVHPTATTRSLARARWSGGAP